MVMDTQPQDVLPDEAGEIQPDQLEQPGAERQDGTEDQTAEPTDQTAAPTDQTAAERQFSQQEVAAIQAAKDTENEKLRQALFQYALNEEIRRAQAEEDQHASRDQQMVSEGQLTLQEATQRSQERTAERQRQIQSQQEQAQVEQQSRQIQAKGEEIGRVLAAQDFGKKYGVDPEVLIKDTSITTPELMEVKARSMQLDAREAKLKGHESFDRGQVGGRGPDLNDMSPSELTDMAYSEAETQKRNRQKRR